ncbi:nucleoside deaminase [Streptomyces sp. NPDC054756]
MRRAVALATESVAEGGGPFGALVVRDGEVIATGTNRVTAAHDPTAHAEVCAVRAACAELGGPSLEGCALIVSCEPCPMCLTAALWARLDRVVYGADRHDAAAAGFDDAALHELFARRDDVSWPLSLERLEVPGLTEPFDAWRALPDREEY